MDHHSVGRVPDVWHQDLQEVRTGMLLLTEDGLTGDITDGIIADLGIPGGITILGFGALDGDHGIIRPRIWAAE